MLVLRQGVGLSTLPRIPNLVFNPIFWEIYTDCRLHRKRTKNRISMQFANHTCFSFVSISVPESLFRNLNLDVFGFRPLTLISESSISLSCIVNLFRTFRILPDTLQEWGPFFFSSRFSSFIVITPSVREELSLSFRRPFCVLERSDELCDWRGPNRRSFLEINAPTYFCVRAVERGGEEGDAYLDKKRWPIL